MAFAERGTIKLTESPGINENMVWHTNLDLHRAESFPTFIPCRPNVGDLVRSTKSWGVFQLELEVVRCVFNANHLEVELHLPKGRWETLRDFYNVYEKMTNQKFI